MLRPSGVDHPASEARDHIDELEHRAVALQGRDVDVFDGRDAFEADAAANHAVCVSYVEHVHNEARALEVRVPLTRAFEYLRERLGKGRRRFVHRGCLSLLGRSRLLAQTKSDCFACLTSAASSIQRGHSATSQGQCGRCSSRAARATATACAARSQSAEMASSMPLGSVMRFTGCEDFLEDRIERGVERTQAFGRRVRPRRVWVVGVNKRTLALRGYLESDETPIQWRMAGQASSA